MRIVTLWSLSYAVLAAGLLCCGCTGFEPDPRDVMLRIEGRVVDVSDGSPIFHATVELRMKDWRSTELLRQAETDREGRYCLRYSEPGHCPQALLILRASMFRFEPLTYTYTDTTHVVCTEEVQTIDFALRRTG